ncbi:MAG: cysteine--tRNA ligase [Saprospiraceae bacterium]|jgi:cysteinyl-tRNA synthetase|nr:cysteine--tRNA ligase [Saprospiraceae bacterium]MBP9209148.1 cysteine--tRNA ligase [Saprospiraceae bacterium]MBV6473621.1 Cysteine--tRNA ligase [Saprospiraceae bacterium]
MDTPQLYIYNSLRGEKELFTPLVPGRVGLYVCGPTVYYEVHLGNCRTFVSFDIIYRYLLHLGYKVRYVRNITDVGHLLDDGEDRMLKGARLEQLQPMEVAQKYTNGFHDKMRVFNVLPPSIEPRATGHIIEQIEMVQAIIDRSYAYIRNGSVYFDTVKYLQDKHPYGQLSGRVVEDLLAESRDDLKNQDEKKHPSDFALWIKASDEHIMRWNSPWSVGFPGWHLECSAMSTKYLGEQFDLHGGGNDLKFPHHENEIAQNVGSCGCTPARYWMHTNMLLLNGRKMSKSEGNTISPEELFSGNSEHISRAYDPMVVRFFFLQAHYRSTLDITDEALQAADRGYRRLMEAMRILRSTPPGLSSDGGERDAMLRGILRQSVNDMNDDFNVPKALAGMFELAASINALKDGHLPKNSISASCWNEMTSHMEQFVYGVFGLADESGNTNTEVVDRLMQLIIEMRRDARERKDFAISDKIRDALKDTGIQLKDGKDGTEWMYL